MSTYCVILTRDVTESALVEIEAESAEDAEFKVIDVCGKYGSEVDGWNIDDNCFNEVYVTGVDLVEGDDDATE